jgi:hypothetical protein
MSRLRRRVRVLEEKREILASKLFGPPTAGMRIRPGS